MERINVQSSSQTAQSLKRSILSSDYTPRPVVYISGPISGSGNLYENINRGVVYWDQMIEDGLAPICPHMNDFGYIMQGRKPDWSTALACDLPLVSRSDALFRIAGDSEGADLEEWYAHRNNVPVFHDYEKLLQYCRGLKLWEGHGEGVTC